MQEIIDQKQKLVDKVSSHAEEVGTQEFIVYEICEIGIFLHDSRLNEMLGWNKDQFTAWYQQIIEEE